MVISPRNRRYGSREELWPLLLEAVSINNVLPLTSSCNLHCVFCSHEQNPPGVRTCYFSPLLLEDLEQLIPFLNGSRKIIVGESSTRLCEGEPLTHPQFLAVLKKIKRQFPETPLQITTNGTLLNKNLLPELKELCGGMPPGRFWDRPFHEVPALELVISLNSSSPSRRSIIMGDNDPQRALEGVRLCGEYGLPFHGSIVAVPHFGGWKDLKETLFFLEEMGALTTRVFLPGYTRFSPREHFFDLSLWRELNDFLQELRVNLEHPVVLEPPLKKDLLARVEGVIRNSPAQQAGLKSGDIIAGVNGEKVLSGAEAFYKIQKEGDPLLEIERPGMGVQNSREEYFLLKLKKRKGQSSGIVIAYDLEAEAIDRIKKEIERKKPENPLLFTSRAAAPLWEAVQREMLLPQHLRINIVENSFWGGSICCAGLLTVSDFTKHLGELTREKEKPDLIIIPLKPFDHRGLDLTGEHYEKLFTAFPQFSFSFL